MTEDRREDQRLEMTLEVRWEGGAGRQSGRISDISLGGCYLDTLGQTEVGEIISLEIKLPDGSWLPLRGSVTFQQPGLGFSLCFTFLTDEEEYQITQLINSQT